MKRAKERKTNLKKHIINNFLHCKLVLTRTSSTVRWTIEVIFRFARLMPFTRYQNHQVLLLFNEHYSCNSIQFYSGTHTHSRTHNWQLGSQRKTITTNTSLPLCDWSVCVYVVQMWIVCNATCTIRNSATQIVYSIGITNLFPLHVDKSVCEWCVYLCLWTLTKMPAKTTKMKKRDIKNGRQTTKPNEVICISKHNSNKISEGRMIGLRAAEYVVKPIWNSWWFWHCSDHLLHYPISSKTLTLFAYLNAIFSIQTHAYAIELICSVVARESRFRMNH